jgi:ATP-dependent Clp protease ATP-binding subunit ClpC
MEHIVRVQLNALYKRMAEEKVTLKVTDAAIKKLALTGYIKEFGARPLKRAIQHHVISPLAIEMLKNPGKKSFVIDVKNDMFVVA